MYEEKKDKEYWQKMYDITTERIMELQTAIKNHKQFRYQRFPMHLLKSNLEAGNYLHSLAYLNLKELQ